MENKILIIVDIPCINDKLELFIPINKKVGTIKNIIIESIDNFDINDKHILINKSDNKIIKENSYIKNSGINNGDRLILL